MYIYYFAIQRSRGNSIYSLCLAVLMNICGISDTDSELRTADVWVKGICQTKFEECICTTNCFIELEFKPYLQKSTLTSFVRISNGKYAHSFLLNLISISFYYLFHETQVSFHFLFSMLYNDISLWYLTTKEERHWFIFNCYKIKFWRQKQPKNYLYTLPFCIPTVLTPFKPKLIWIVSYIYPLLSAQFVNWTKLYFFLIATKLQTWGIIWRHSRKNNSSRST